MNKVILMGRLTRNPEIFEGNIKVAKYTLAVDRRIRSDRQSDQSADFIQCTAFGAQADFAEKWLVQGKKVVVTGRLQSSSYTNKSGQKIYATDVVIEDQEFAESKASEQGRNDMSGSNGDYGRNRGNSGRSTTGYNNPPNAGDGFMNIPDGIDEELPFN